MIQTIIQINQALNTFIWGIPAMVAIIGVGLLLTIRTRFLQVRKFSDAMKNTIGKVFDRKKAQKGSISPFQAVCTALAGTVGTGNIAGVAGAVAIGGPGAVFWMWCSAFLGMCTKFAEVTLAVRYREKSKDGEYVGGPMYYIKNGLSHQWLFLAYAYSILGILTVFGTGNATQVNTIVAAINEALLNMHAVQESQLSSINLILGIIIMGLVAVVLLGGIKRIGRVSERLVPFMAILYAGCVIVLMMTNATALPAAIREIVVGAFNPRAVTGGAIGSMIIVMQKGIARGIFSNEAGLGSAPIAAAAAKTKEPVRQGLVSMTGTFIDTIVICTMTGISIVLTGAWKVKGLEGVAVTTYAFTKGLPFSASVASCLLMLCLVFFAFTTILGWNYYAERCLEYLTNNSKLALNVFKAFYILNVFIGPYMSISAVWTIADIFNGLMAIPNMIAVISLNGVIVAETKRFFARYRSTAIEKYES